MNRSFTSDIAPHAHGFNIGHTTSSKARLLDTTKHADYLTGNNLIHVKQHIFDFFDESRHSGQCMLFQSDNEDSKQ